MGSNQNSTQPGGDTFERIAVLGVLAVTVISLFFALRAAHRSGPVSKEIVHTVAVAPDADAVAHSRGRTLYNKCIFCHGKDADGDKKQNAPSLRVQEDWYIVRQLQKFKAGVRGVDPKDIGGVQMRPRAMELSEEDMHLVADYIVSSNKGRLRMPPKTVDGDVAHGKSLYSVCIACHGEDGRGNELLNAPSLVGQHDWYLVQQLMNFREGFRGADPNDTTGVVMKPMAMTLADDQAVADVAAYITTLSARSPHDDY